MLKMKIAPDELLITKGQKSGLDELMKTKKLLYFHDNYMNLNDLILTFGLPPNAIALPTPCWALGQRVKLRICRTKSRKTIARIILFNARIS